MKKEENISRKFAIAVIAILVIILVTNNFNDLTGQATTTRLLRKSVATGTCYDSDGGGNLITQSYKGGYASYGGTTLYDECASYGEGSRALIEAICRSNTWASTYIVTCTNGCMKTYYGDACKQVVQTTQRTVRKR